MQIIVQATEMDMTDAIRQYAEEKVQSLEKFYQGITKAEVDVGLRSHHHNKGKNFYAEVNLHVPHHPLVRVVKDAEDLYKAIDKVRDHLKVELEKLKGKQNKMDRNAIRAQKETFEE